MPAPSPCARIEQVARDLGRLGEELEAYAGPDAKRTLLYWADELLIAIAQLERPDFRRPPGPRPMSGG